MTDAELAKERENWYNWFHEERTRPMWAEKGCPVIKEQTRHVEPSTLRFYPEHVPISVEIGNGPHITLDDLSCGVNRRVRCGSLNDRQQCTDMSVTIHTSEALLGM